ncbi:hypothetical protein [Vibrio sp. D431a]|uniref:hypothetical protein n=1 Tax=Vibrio sp. D431a TaxID=2837388 RepID=UPI002552B5C2|nr:hypothetical protein [Vibrio sp. D431a]
MTISKISYKDHDGLCRRDTYKPLNELVMDVSSIGGVSSVKKAEMTEVTKSNGDRGYAKASSSRRDVVDLREDGVEQYTKNALGRQKPNHSLLASKDESLIDEQLENGTYEVDVDLLAQRIAALF